MDTLLLSCSSMTGSNFFVDKSIVILQAMAPIKTEMHHGTMVIIPIRWKMKSLRDDLVDFMPGNTPHHCNT